MVRANDRFLRGRSVRLIGADSEQLGIVEVEEALEKAAEAKMDLVLVADQSDPAVCRIMNFGKAQYERKRKEREQKRKQATQKNKEVKFHANIDKHDYDYKVNHIIDFLKKGFRVKVSLYFRGREMAHRDKGLELMQRIVADIGELGVVEMTPRMVGRSLTMSFTPAQR